LLELAGGKPILPRTYLLYHGPESAPGLLQQVAMLAQRSIPWDLVLCCRAASGELAGWTRLIRTLVERFGSRMDALQITNEADLKGLPGAADGHQPRAVEALVAGVLTARQAIVDSAATVRIGFSVVPGFSASDFWPRLRALTTGEFLSAVDYVGCDLYPGVFGPPVPLERMGETVLAHLRKMRTVILPAAGFPETVALRVTENGWPTGPDRSEQLQAEVLEAIVRALHHEREALHLTHYEYFGLRDANSALPDLFHRFGLLRDDYTPKPAFAMLARLMAELG
jgi:hypothetical protein